MKAENRKSRANALKHGLAARVIVANKGDRLNQLIVLLAPDCDDKEMCHAARQAAEALLYCQRVSQARSELIEWVRGCADNHSGSAPPHLAKASDRLLRYE